MTSAAASGALTQFEHFAIDASRGAVLRDGETITLRPQSFRVLQYLVANPDRLISKEELFDRIWGEAVVTDDSLAQCLVDIRRALGDEGRQAVRTLPRRGYLFSARAMDAPAVDAPAAVPPPASADGSGGIRGAWLALGVLGLAAVLLASWLLLRPAPDSVDTPAASSPVVAVLPFADFTPAGDRDYLALGLPEEIINSLTQVNGLRVISRTSSFLPQLGQQLTAREIGAQLGATHLLEGSIREHDGLLRITVQLIETDSGHHVWSETLDRRYGDILRVQSQVASAVAHLFQLTVMEPVEPDMVIAADDYTLYLRALHALRSGEFAELGNAITSLEGVARRSPRFIPVRDLLTWSYLLQVYRGELSATDVAQRVRALAEEMLAVPSGRAGAHGALAALALKVENDLPAAAEHVTEALAREPGNPRYLETAGDLAYALERFSAAVALYQAALDLDPFCTGCYMNQAQAYIAAGQLRQAEVAVRQVMERSRGGHLTLGLTRIMQGDFAAAREIIDRPIPAKAKKFQEFYQALLCQAEGDIACFRSLLERFEAENGESEAMRIAQLRAVGGDADAAFRWLARLRERNQTLLLLNLPSPLFDNLRDDPRWERMLAELGRAPQQLRQVAFDAEALLESR
jgi:TolB-like protein/DNA-binding winged helix-turn-helix (wHTH) protein